MGCIIFPSVYVCDKSVMLGLGLVQSDTAHCEELPIHTNDFPLNSVTPVVCLWVWLGLVQSDTAYCEELPIHTDGFPLNSVTPVVCL